MALCSAVVLGFISTVVRVSLVALAAASLAPGGTCPVGVVAGEILEGLVTSEFAITPEEDLEGSLVELLELSDDADTLAWELRLESSDVFCSGPALSTVSSTTSHVGTMAVLGAGTQAMLGMSLLAVISVTGTGCFSTASGCTWAESLEPH